MSAASLAPRNPLRVHFESFDHPPLESLAGRTGRGAGGVKLNAPVSFHSTSAGAFFRFYYFNFLCSSIKLYRTFPCKSLFLAKVVY